MNGWFTCGACDARYRGRGAAMQCCASHFGDDDPDEGAATLLADGSGATEHAPTLDSGYHAVCDPCGWTGDPYDTKGQPARDCQQHDVDEHGGTVTSEIRPVAYDPEADR